MYGTLRQVIKLGMRGGAVVQAGSFTPTYPTTATEIRVFNRRLRFSEPGVPLMSGGQQLWYDQLNSLYFTNPLVTVDDIDTIGYHTYHELQDGSIIRGEGIGYPVYFDATALDSFTAAYSSGGIYWQSYLRVDVPKSAFAWKPYSIAVVLNGVELDAKVIPWEVIG